MTYVVTSTEYDQDNDQLSHELVYKTDSLKTALNKAYEHIHCMCHEVYKMEKRVTKECLSDKPLWIYSGKQGLLWREVFIQWI